MAREGLSNALWSGAMPGPSPCGELASLHPSS